MTARYLRLPQTEREAWRAAARHAAVRADSAYADLLAAEAALAARREQPDTARLVFSLDEDAFGTCTTLVAAYDRSGRWLWHIDIDGEWPDESLVTDLLADAWDWYRGDLFPAARENPDLFEFTLPDPVPSPARITVARAASAGGCACRNASDARDPAGHNNQVRLRDRCLCLCHGDR